MVQGKNLTLAIFLAAFAGCTAFETDGSVEVAVIGAPESVYTPGLRLAPAAQHARAASREGLVALDPAGQVVPAIAERWIVTDKGLSYIFRLRERSWPDGELITAEDVRASLRDVMRRLEGTSLGLDLSQIIEVRAMTERVVELRLSSPMPDFLRLLAQPELGIVKSGSGAGPMVMSRDEDTAQARFNALPPEERGLPRRLEWEDQSRSVSLRALPASQAINAFSQGDVDLLLNGTLPNFPLVDLGPFSRGAIQVDPMHGLMGLVVRSDSGILADPARREALAMAIDRASLVRPFSISGWQSRIGIVPPALLGSQAGRAERWSALSLAERRQIAASRIAAWRSENADEDAVIRVGMPPGPGSDLIFSEIASAWAAIGVRAAQTLPGAGAELEWRDTLARYSGARWYLNQFNCQVAVGLCSEDADALVAASLDVIEPRAKAQMLSEAHNALIEKHVFISFGQPLRWTLVRGSVSAYASNPWGLHPLFPLSEPTT